MEAAATTEGRGRRRPDERPPSGRRVTGAGPDRASVMLLSAAAFLAVLALLAWQVRATPATTARQRIVIVRHVYQTTVVETIKGAGSGTSVSQSVSSSGSGSLAVAPVTTRSSSVR